LALKTPKDVSGCKPKREECLTPKGCTPKSSNPLSGLRPRLEVYQRREKDPDQSSTIKKPRAPVPN
jgi:hypothetical protein